MLFFFLFFSFSELRISCAFLATFNVHWYSTEAVVRRWSVNKGALRNFAKFTGKHVCQSLFFNKVAGLRQISKSTFFYRTPPVAAFDGKPLSSEFQIYVGKIAPFPSNIILTLYHNVTSFLYHSCLRYNDKSISKQMN